MKQVLFVYLTVDGSKLEVPLVLQRQFLANLDGPIEVRPAAGGSGCANDGGDAGSHGSAKHDAKISLRAFPRSSRISPAEGIRAPRFGARGASHGIGTPLRRAHHDL